MHDLLVVVGTLVGFIALIWITGYIFDELEDRYNEEKFTALNEFLESGNHHLDYAIVSLINAELQSRTSMMGEFAITPEHRVLLATIATYLFVLAKADVRNQMHLLTVICEQLNRHGGYTARISITTNNRLELIIQLGTDERLLYLKLHSINTLF